MKYRERVGLKTIAYELGISINTVSRALRDCDDISAKTKENVRRVAQEVGYLPNNLIYSINNKSKSVALVINNVKNHYFSIMNEKLLFCLRSEGYLPHIICLYGNDFDASVVKECVYQRVDKIITYVEPTKEALDLININRLSLIVCGRKISKKNCDVLYTDDVKGGGLAAKYLYNKGSKNFVYINVRGSECSIRRYNGFVDTLISLDPNLFVKKINIEDFDRKINEVISLDNLGIFAYNDEHLFIVLDKLKVHGFDTSKLNIIGYDGVCNHILGTIKVPSIAFDYDAMVRECMRLINRDGGENVKHVAKCFDVYLEDIQ